MTDTEQLPIPAEPAAGSTPPEPAAEPATTDVDQVTETAGADVDPEAEGDAGA